MLHTVQIFAVNTFFLALVRGMHLCKPQRTIRERISKTKNNN